MGESVPHGENNSSVCMDLLLPDVQCVSFLLLCSKLLQI